MALKNKYATAAEIPAELKSFYVERDGAWLLDSERNEELRQTNITVMKERDALLKRFEGIDPDEVRKLADEKRKLEEAAQLKAGEFDKVLAARLKEFQDKNLTPMQARAEAAEKRLAVVMIDDAVRDAALKRGVIPSALPDVMARARGALRLVDGQVRVYDGENLVMGKDGVTPMISAEWVDALASSAAHLFQANAGGGAAGSGSRGAGSGVVNPFRKETWNLTEQVKLQMRDPGLAARLQASAN